MIATIRKIKNNKLLKILFGIIKTIIYIVVILMLVITLTQKITRNNVSFGGFRLFTVVSGSMKGEYDVGDIILLKTAEPEDIKIGDNVSYISRSGTSAGYTITHKVIKKEHRDDKYYFITQGIANEVADPEIEYSQIYGKVIYRTILLSFCSKLMMKQIVYYGLFVLFGLTTCIEIASNKFNRDKEAKDGESKE